MTPTEPRDGGPGAGATGAGAFVRARVAQPGGPVKICSEVPAPSSLIWTAKLWSSSARTTGLLADAACSCPMVSGTSRIAQHLDAVRRALDRVEPSDLAAVMADGALVVDIRPQSNRREEGELPGAVVVERIHLEWRIDPTSPDRIPEATPGRRVVIVCNEGYSSSLAAQSLRALGVDATDLVGGYRALPGGPAS